MRLSVIVPVYNVEQTLRRCVTSIVGQNVDNMEIIMVNDGSTDGSAAIAEDMARTYGNITLINQNNRGLSAARNTGIEASSGEYITFVDSDDWLLDNTYAELLDTLDSHTGCDILEYKPIDNGVGRVAYNATETAVYPSAKDYWLKGEAYRHTYAWNKIFRRKVLFSGNRPEVRFPEGRFFEDVYFLSAMLARNPRVIVTQKEGYVYCYNTDGITVNAGTKGHRDLLEGHLQAARMLQMDFLKQDTRIVSADETAYFLTVLNIQICACRCGIKELSLPERKVKLGACPLKAATIAKVILLNLFGMRMFQSRFI